MQQVEATDLEIWQRIGISQCPTGLLGTIITKCLNPLEQKLPIKIERLTATDGNTSIVSGDAIEKNPDAILGALKILSGASIGNVSVWLQIKENSVEEFKSRLAEAGYDIDITAKKFEPVA